MDLAVSVLELGDQLKKSGSVVLANQLHSSAVSVPSNIAEGHGRRSRREYARFVRNAQGSSRELLTQLELVGRSRKRYSRLARMLWRDGNEVGRMLNALYTSLQKPPKDRGDPSS
jgi:four helix bundle protein